jgi:hypothetical protein
LGPSFGGDTLSFYGNPLNGENGGRGFEDHTLNQLRQLNTSYENLDTFRSDVCANDRIEKKMQLLVSLESFIEEHFRKIKNLKD